MKWISVKDKLPDNYSDCLVFNTSGFMHVVYYNHPHFLYKPTMVGLKSIVAEGPRAITHWMPLPQPPTP